MFYYYIIFSYVCFSDDILSKIEIMAKKIYDREEDNRFISGEIMSWKDFIIVYKDKSLELLEEGDDEILLSLAECVFLNYGSLGTYFPREYSFFLALKLLKVIKSNALTAVRINEISLYSNAGFLDSNCALGLINNKQILIMQSSAIE